MSVSSLEWKALLKRGHLQSRAPLLQEWKRLLAGILSRVGRGQIKLQISEMDNLRLESNTSYPHKNRVAKSLPRILLDFQ